MHRTIKVTGNSKELEQIKQYLGKVGYSFSYPVMLSPTEMPMISDETGNIPILYTMTVYNDDHEDNPAQYLPTQLAADVMWQEEHFNH